MDAASMIKERVTKMKPVQEYLLDYIDQNENQDENFNKLTKYLNDQNLVRDKREFTIFLHILSQISSNYHRSPDFFNKIERILILYQEDIRNYFTSIEIFNFFIDSKRILLFFFEKEMITADQSICSIITSSKYKQRNYPQYFYPEFKAFLNDSYKSNDPEFEQKRKIGDNDQQICKIIRDDDVDLFTSFAKEHDISLVSVIKDSIYETHSLLLKDREITLIEYSAFNGSLKVFNYLKSNMVELTPSLWFYAIHGQNLDILQILDSEKIDVLNKMNFGTVNSNDFYRMFLKCQNSNLNDSIKQAIEKDNDDIKCFTNCIKNYNYVKLDEIITNDPNILNNILNDNHKEFKLFYALCKYDYIVMVDFFLENMNTKVISLIILKIVCSLIKFEIKKKKNNTFFSNFVFILYYL